MTGSTLLAPLLERFFTDRLQRQRQASPHTIASYRDTFRLLLKFAYERLHTPPARLTFEAVGAPLVSAFLEHLEHTRRVCVRSRNLRLTAIHSFFRYAAFEAPTHAAQIQRVLAIPTKRFTRRQIAFLTRPEIEALLATPDQRTWFGRRDYALLLVFVQTGLRLSELTALKRHDVMVDTGAHVRVIGKGRKERCTPLAKSTVAVLKAWLREPPRGNEHLLFPTARGTRLSADAVEYLVTKYRAAAAKACPSIQDKRITTHCLRHSSAMELLQAGVDRSVIALWLGHESLDTTQVYLEATLAMKEQALAKTTPLKGRFRRYRPGDQLLGFLNSL
jgi:site-specific recombinase XerD